MVRAALIGWLALMGCNSDEHRTRSKVPLDEPDPAITSSTTAHEQAPPPTVTELVTSGKHWRLDTAHGPVHVWIPRGYNEKRAETVVYVHGFYTHVDQAWKEHHLDSQFAASAINAMFVACEAPSTMTEPVSWSSITELLDAVEQGIGQPRPKRRIVAVGHSGAYRTLLGWLDEPVLDTVVLLDAAYGEIEAYRTWVLAAPRHRLIDVGDDTKQWTEQLHAELPTTVILDDFPKVEDEIPKSAAKAKILYIRSSLGHFPLVTGGVALPMVLRTLRAKRLLDVPLAEILD
jgi:hypothetical protein